LKNIKCSLPIRKDLTSYVDNGNIKTMDLYKDWHDEAHYHLGTDQYDAPTGQNKIFEKIVTLLEKKVQHHNLHLRYNNEYSINIVDEQNRSYIFLNCYKYRGSFPPKWRVKIRVYERGEEFFQKVFTPLISSIPDKKR